MKTEVGPATRLPPLPGLQRLIAAVEEFVAGLEAPTGNGSHAPCNTSGALAHDAPWPHDARPLLAALRQAVVADDLLHDSEREGAADHYRRHLLHVDPQRRFTILALVWRPGQTSPVHGHNAWCGVGIVEGTATEERLEGDGTSVGTDIAKPRTHGAGEATLSLPGRAGIHRLSNRGAGPLISIHVYGMDLERDPAAINVVYDAWSACVANERHGR